MNETVIWKIFNDTNLEDHSVIIPSVAVGNVGQLACDLLISSMHMKKVASVYSPAMIPVLGLDPYDLQSKMLAGSCDMYKSDTNKVAVLQFRAPLINKFAVQFLNNVVNTLKEKNLKDIFILTSSYAYEKKHISTSPFRFVAPASSCYREQILKLNLVEHETESNDIKIFGGGFASLLYKICQENLVPCIILYKYCSEGDNIPDAYDMVSYVASLLQLFSKKSEHLIQLVKPPSWKLLFGRPPPGDIY